MKMMDFNKYLLYVGVCWDLSAFMKSGLIFTSQRVRASSEAGNGAAKTCRHFCVGMFSTSTILLVRDLTTKTHEIPNIRKP